MNYQPEMNIFVRDGLKFFAKSLCSNVILKHHFSQINTFMRKGKDLNPGGTKTFGSCGSGSPTLVSILHENCKQTSMDVKKQFGYGN
jgi:hypothetical protein